MTHQDKPTPPLIGALTLLVDLVHRTKVVHVLEVHVDLDDLLPGRACSLEHVAEVSNALRLAVSRIDALAGRLSHDSYRVLLDAALDNFAVAADGGLSTEEDQARDLGSMRCSPLICQCPTRVGCMHVHKMWG